MKDSPFPNQVSIEQHLSDGSGAWTRSLVLADATLCLHAAGIQEDRPKLQAHSDLQQTWAERKEHSTYFNDL